MRFFALFSINTGLTGLTPTENTHPKRGNEVTNTAEIIRSSVTMKDACNMYGYTPDRAGFILCPIHNEKTASLKIYPGKNGWFCFGCCTGGSVIDFVMHIFGVDFRQAVVRLDNDFGLHLTEQPLDKTELLRLRRERTEKERKCAEFDRQYLEKVRQHREYVNVLNTQKPINKDGSPNETFMTALKERPYLEYWLDDQMRRFERR